MMARPTIRRTDDTTAPDESPEAGTRPVPEEHRWRAGDGSAVDEALIRVVRQFAKTRLPKAKSRIADWF